MRPLGAIILLVILAIDSVERQRWPRLFILMAIPTTLIGMLPTYEQVEFTQEFY